MHRLIMWITVPQFDVVSYCHRMGKWEMMLVEAGSQVAGGA